MTEHLSLQEFEDFRQRKLSPAELLRVGDHLAECEACRQLGEGEGLWDRFQALQAALGAGEGEEPYHLSAEEMSGYLDGTLDEVDREVVEGHLALCPDCQAEVQDLREFRESLRGSSGRIYAPPSRSGFRERWRAFWFLPAVPGGRWVAVGAMAVLLLALVMVFRPRPAVLDGRLLAAREASALTALGLDESAQALWREKIPQGKPVVLAALPAPPVVMRGGGSEAPILQVLRPYRGEALLERRVEVVWRAVPEVSQYRVRIYRETDLGQPLWEGPVSGTAVTVDLEPGEEYLVYVEAMGREWPPGKRQFRVLSPAEGQQLQGRLRSVRGSHLLRGILYEKCRCYRQALREYQRLLQQHPEDPLAQEIYRQFREYLGPPSDAENP